MTNIGQLPQLTGSFSLANNADWRCYLQFVLASNPSESLDLTGIAFSMQVRPAVGNAEVVLDISTGDGTLVNGGTNGMLSWAVPLSALATLPPGNYVADLIATGDGQTINLFETAPAQINVIQGVTR